jgi:hypothetical protein
VVEILEPKTRSSDSGSFRPAGAEGIGVTVTFTVTVEKIVALLALAGFLLLISGHRYTGAACELAIAVITILRL